MARAKPYQPVNREINREARRIFRLLVKPGRFLARLEGKDGQFGVLSRRTRNCRASVITTRAFVDAFIAKGWISAASGDGWVLNDAGAAWLRRIQAAEDPFLAQHRLNAVRTIEAANGALEILPVNEGEDPLGWLRARKGRGGKPLLGSAQLEAGLRLRRDFTHGHFTPRMTASWQQAGQGRKGRRNRAGGGVELSDAALAARQRFRKSLAAVGPELSGVLVDICCFLTGLEDAEKINGWPQRSGKLVLQMALSALARHYGLISDQGSGRRNPVRHWGAEDYRPHFDADAAGAQDESALRASS